MPIRYLVALTGAADIAALLLGAMMAGAAVLVAMILSLRWRPAATT